MQFPDYPPVSLSVILGKSSCPDTQGVLGQRKAVLAMLWMWQQLNSRGLL